MLTLKPLLLTPSSIFVLLPLGTIGFMAVLTGESIWPNSTHMKHTHLVQLSAALLTIHKWLWLQLIVLCLDKLLLLNFTAKSKVDDFFKDIFYMCTVKPASAVTWHHQPSVLSGYISGDGSVSSINHLQCRPSATYLCQKI